MIIVCETGCIVSCKYIIHHMQHFFILFVYCLRINLYFYLHISYKCSVKYLCKCQAMDWLNESSLHLSAIYRRRFSVAKERGRYLNLIASQWKLDSFFPLNFLNFLLLTVVDSYVDNPYGCIITFE